jgi:hypothetical protein
MVIVFMDPGMIGRGAFKILDQVDYHLREVAA